MMWHRDEGLTIFCPFTRAWCLGPFFEALALSDVPISRATLVAYVDTDEPELARAVEARARRLPFHSVVVAASGLLTPNDGAGPVRRRRRHSLMRQLSQGLVTGNRRLLLLEDDTLVPQRTYQRLLEASAGAEWVTGAEVGRWGRSRPPGVWRISTEGGRAVRKAAMLPGPLEVEPIEASGLYCALTTTEVYRSMEFGAWSDPIGLDTHATYRLTKAGHRLLVHWGVPCVHLSERGRLTMAEAQAYSRPIRTDEDAPNQRVAVAQELSTMRQLSNRRHNRGRSRTHRGRQTGVAHYQYRVR